MKVEFSGSAGERIMGCDIHDYYEVRRHGRWEKVGSVLPSPFFDPNEPESATNKRKTPYLIGRNYRLFAILADVRNRWEMKYIAEARYEIPHDVSKEVFVLYAERHPDWYPDDETPRPEVERWNAEGYARYIETGEMTENSDCHSASWHSLRTLMEHNWQTPEPFVQIVDADGYQKFKQSGRIDSWWEVAAESAEITNEEMEERIAAGTTTPNCRTAAVRGEKTHASFAGHFFTEGLPALFRLAVGSDHPEAFALARAVLDGDKTALSPLDDWLLEHGCLSLDDVRMVFWFDN